MVATFQEAKPKLLKLYAKYAQEKVGAPDKKEASPLASSSPSSSWPQLLSARKLKSMLYDGGMFCAGDTKLHDEIFENVGRVMRYLVSVVPGC